MKRKIVDGAAKYIYENFDKVFRWEKWLDWEHFRTIYRADMRVMENEGN